MYPKTAAGSFRKIQILRFRPEGTGRALQEAAASQSADAETEVADGFAAEALF